MNASSDLCKLYTSIKRRLWRFKIIFNSILFGIEYQSRINVSYLIIETDNLIKSAAREFIVSTLLGTRTRNRMRTKTAVSLNSHGEVYAYILSVLNSKKFINANLPKTISLYETPTIRSGHDIHKVLAASCASNIDSLNNALALNFNFFDDVPTLRNFYAHRNSDTFSKVRRKSLNWGIGRILHADDLVLSRRPGRPVSVFEDWLTEVDIFFDVLTS